MKTITTFLTTFFLLLGPSYILLYILFYGKEDATGMEGNFWIIAPILCFMGALINTFANYEYNREV